MKFRRLIGAVCVLAALLASTGSAFAETAAEFYRGKVIKLVVGYGAGGGYDIYARLLAPYLEERLGATVVVENRIGGGGTIALNQVYAARPDGLTLQLLNGRAAAISQLLKREGVRFDLTKLTILGRITSEPRVILFSAESPYRSLEDALKSPRPIKWGAGIKTDSLASVAAIASTALGMRSEIITGYKGSKEASLAVIRGEVDALVASESSAVKYAKGGKMIPIVTFGRDRSELLPDLPTVFEALPLDQEQAWWADFTAQLSQIGRVLVTAPGVPEERKQYLRQVLQSILQDPAVQDAMAKKKRLLRYEAAEQVESFISSTLGSLDEETLARVHSVILERHYSD